MIHTRMSLLLIKIKEIFLLLFSLILTITSYANGKIDSVVMNDDLLSKKTSFRFVPSNYMTQFAGSIGLVSAGFGWDYGKKKRWSTDFLIGYVPKYSSERSKVTFTIRQSYTPWEIKIYEGINFHPLRTGLFVSTTAGRQFWFSSPDKYPTDYYTFSTKIRFNILFGQDFDFKVPSSTSYFDRIKFYYDFHTSDFNLISRVQNNHLKNKMYFGLALGLKMHIRK